MAVPAVHEIPSDEIRKELFTVTDCFQNETVMPTPILTKNRSQGLPYKVGARCGNGAVARLHFFYRAAWNADAV